MPRFLSGLFGGDALERKTAADQRAAQGSGYYYAGNPYISSWDVDRMVREGYERVIWVFKAIDALADKVSSWPIRVMDGYEPDWREVDDPIKAVLNQRANALDGSAKFFRYRLSSQLILSKKGVFIEVIPSKGGGIAALNLLPPARTNIVPGANGQIESFEIQMADGDRPRLPVYDPARRRGVVWIRKPHPTDPYSGVTPLEAAGISIDLDFYARLYNRNFLLNDGRSGQIVAVKGGLSHEDAAELKRRFSPGMNGAGRTTVLEADSVSVSDTAVTPRDAQYAELRGITKEDLLIALGTPESVIGNASGRTFDNADAELENWLTVTVLPHAGVIGHGFDVLTEGGYEDDRQCVHDTRGEPVLNRAKRMLVADARADLDAGRITVDEFRAVAELDPMEAAGSDVLWVPAGRIAIGDPEAVAAATALVPSGSGMGPAAAPGEGSEAETPAIGTPQAQPQALGTGESTATPAVYGSRGLPWSYGEQGYTWGSKALPPPVECDDPDELMALLGEER